MVLMPWLFAALRRLQECHALIELRRRLDQRVDYREQLRMFCQSLEPWFDLGERVELPNRIELLVEAERREVFLHSAGELETLELRILPRNKVSDALASCFHLCATESLMNCEKALILKVRNLRGINCIKSGDARSCRRIVIQRSLVLLDCGHQN